MKKKIIAMFIMGLLISTAIFVSGVAINKDKTSSNSEYFIEEFYNSFNIFETLNDGEEDQQQTINTGSERIRALSAGLAQSFIPSETPLIEISIFLTKNYGNTDYANYYIEIREDIHNPTYLRRITIPGFEFTTYTNFWLSYDFLDITVIPGNTYWIVCYAEILTPDTNQVKWCYGSPGDPYPNGNSMQNTILGWSPYDLWGDFCFKTYKPSGGSNNPPYAPSQPNGPSTGKVGSAYQYSTSAIDPDGDDIKYGWDWDGDGITDEYSGFYASGTTCTMTHVWDYPGTYNVKVKARDENDALSGFSAPLTVIISEENNPPNKPDTPSGAINGITGTSYSYSTSTTDPEDNQVYYLYDWGDGSNSGWLGPYDSGDIINTSHTWDADGTYPLKVKAKDTNDAESVWSDPVSISMPKSKTYLPLGVIIVYGLDVDVKIVQLEPGEDYVDLEVLSKPFYIWGNSIITRNPGEFIRLYSAKGLFSPSLPICFGICSDWGIIG